jgi:hypothetical protein
VTIETAQTKCTTNVSALLILPLSQSSLGSIVAFARGLLKSS